MTWMDFLAQNAWKASVLLMAAFAVNLALRRSSAALRHFLWAAVLGALLVLPAATALTPKWGWRTNSQKVVVKARSTVRPMSAVRGQPERSTPVKQGSWSVSPFVPWAIGFLIVAIRFASAWARMGVVVRQARGAEYATIPAAEIGAELGFGGPIPILESDKIPMPVAWGIVRPTVVLPAAAGSWSESRLRTVLLHEMLHVGRRDVLAQAVGQAACSLFWFHPLAWIAARQMRIERERACDDAVLLQGVAPHDYAGHLVDCVKAMASRPTGWTGAAMAEASDLETRVRALLDRRRVRHPLSRRAAVAIACAAAAVMVPLAGLTAYAQSTRGSISGKVLDPSGARIPGCEVVAKNLDGSNQEVTRADEAGEYHFNSIPAGRYAMEFRAPGFTVAKMETPLAGGNTVQADMAMTIGTATERMQVLAAKPASATKPLAARPQRIPVGGNVQPAKITFRIDPVYPPDAQSAGVEGSVVIRAVISKNGDVLNPQVVNTVDQRLANAALNAVSQWRYSPTLLNGHPVEMLTTVTLDFKLTP